MNWIPTVVQSSFDLPSEPFCLNPQEYRIARGLTLGLFEDQLWLVDKNEVSALEGLVTLYDADIYEGITVQRDKFLLPVLRPIGVSGDRWSSSFEEAVSNEIGGRRLTREIVRPVKRPAGRARQN